MYVFIIRMDINSSSKPVCITIITRPRCYVIMERSSVYSQSSFIERNSASVFGFVAVNLNGCIRSKFQSLSVLHIDSTTIFGFIVVNFTSADIQVAKSTCVNGGAISIYSLVAVNFAPCHIQYGMLILRTIGNMNTSTS